MLLLGSILAALGLLVVTSNTLFVVGASAWVVSGGVVAAVHVSLRRPFHEAALVMLIVAWAADLLASGPPGMHGLALTLVFFAIYALAQRVGGRYLLATFALAVGGALALTFAEGLLVSLLFEDATGMRLFATGALPSVLLTGVVSIPYTVVLAGMERLWRRRTERSIVVD